MFLGIDIGTSVVKVVVIDDEGHVVETRHSPLPISRPKPKWSEQEPDHWWQAVRESVCSLPAECRRMTRAIGLTGQMHGAVLLDSDQTPLRPAILWNDGRSEAEAKALQTLQADFVERGANLVMPGFTAPKLAWVRTHEPEVFDQTQTVLLPKDFVRLRMTGELATDMSDAAGTLWLDVERRAWHPPLLEACGLTEQHMPRLHEGPETTGTLRPDVASEWGMDEVPVVAGGSDNAAGALGAGAIGDGDTILSLGTSGVIFSATDTLKKNPDAAVHAFCHALPDRWHLMSVILSAASCLDWACRITNTHNVNALIELAEAEFKPDSRVTFLPYLSGERTPHNDANACGVFWGMSHDTGAADIANAVLEGVAFGLADGFDALISTGVSIETLSVIGGGSRSTHWGRILASALSRPLIYREGADVGPAFGAARLAKFGTDGGDAAKVFSKPAAVSRVEPDQSLSSLYPAKRTRFSALYHNLKNLSEEG